MSFIVKWGRERLHFPLPPPETKLAVIRRTIAEYTHLPELSFKLIRAGAVMKDDNAPISAYSIRENTTLLIVGSAAPLPSSPPLSAFPSYQQHPAKPRPSTKSQHEPKTEQNTITQIRSEVDKVRQTLVPSVNTFLHTITTPPSTSDSVPTTTSASSSPDEAAATAYIQTRSDAQDTAPSQPHAVAPPPSSSRAPGNLTPEQEHTRLSELLLQSLLRLDAIATDGSWEHARAERKGAVKEVQGLLDRLDGGWGRRGKV